MEKSEVIQKKNICTFLWSENIRFYIFTSENIKYTIYINNIFLYFTSLYIIKRNWPQMRIEEFRIIGFYLYHVTSIRPSNSIGASGSLTASLNIDYDRGSTSYYR